MAFIKRVIGLMMVLIGASGIVVSVLSARFGHQAVDNITLNLDSTLQLVNQSLDNVSETLVLARSTLTEVTGAVDTVEETTDNLATTVRETRPLLSQIGTVATEDVPDSLEAIETAFPSLEQVAGVIDSTLTTLNSFRIEEEILGVEFNYDLGVDYEPEIPFDESVANLGDSLDGLPESLRSLQVYLNVTTGNLDTMSQDIYNLADDIGDVNEQIGELDPILSEYLVIIGEINDDTRAVRQMISTNVTTMKQGITVLAVWFALTQVAPLYLGFELLFGRRGTNGEDPRSEAEEDKVDGEAETAS